MQDPAAALLLTQAARAEGIGSCLALLNADRFVQEINRCVMILHYFERLAGCSIVLADLIVVALLPLNDFKFKISFVRLPTSADSDPLVPTHFTLRYGEITLPS